MLSKTAINYFASLAFRYIPINVHAFSSLERYPSIYVLISPWESGIPLSGKAWKTHSPGNSSNVDIKLIKGSHK